MNCRGVSRRLSAYIDDELSPGIRQALDDHLRSCVSCRRKLSELKIISDSARSLESLRVSPGFKERVVISALERRERVMEFSGFRLRVALGSMAFVAAATMVFLIAGPNTPNPITPSSNGSAAELDHPTDGQQAEPLDFTEDPKIKIESFPIPENAKALDRIADSVMLADSMSRIDEFVLPVVEEAKENVNIKF